MRRFLKLFKLPAPPTGGSSRDGGVFRLHVPSTGRTVEFPNLVPTVSLNNQNDVYWDASAQTTVWYLGLIGGTPTFAAGDTMSSHAGWTELTNYDEATRPIWTVGASAGGVSTNSAVVVFTMDGTTDVAGAFVVSVNTKGGTTGILGACGALDGGTVSVPDNEEAQLTYTYTRTSV